MSPQEFTLVAWALKGLVALIVGLVCWVFLRELSRMDKRVTDEVEAIYERIQTEVKYRDAHNASVDQEVASLRVRQHELGNTMAGQAGAVESAVATIARVETVLTRLEQTVNDLRVLIAETRGHVPTESIPRR